LIITSIRSVRFLASFRPFLASFRPFLASSSTRNKVEVGHTAQRTGEMPDPGFLAGIDTDCFRGGWLTALDVTSGEVIQANQQGQVRRSRREPRHRSPLDLSS
jgi:serine/threonine protein phosphatase 1